VSGGFDAHSKDSVANIANEIYGDETIDPKLMSNRIRLLQLVNPEAVEVSKARLAAECFKENTFLGDIFGKVSMPKLLEMPKPGEDLYKRWILLRSL
jgi:uncharacterized protein YozE (UPF0346 family)